MPEVKQIEHNSLFEIEGQRINVSSPNDAINCIIAKLEQRKPLAPLKSFHVFTLNLDHLVKLRRDDEFRDAYRTADVVTADGFPIVTLARLDRVSIERTTGSDLVLPLCTAAARHGFPVFFFGTSLSALCAAAQRLAAQASTLDVRGVFSPPMGFVVGSDLAKEAIRIVEESGARICFVALSPPLQEKFAAAASERTANIAFVAVGAGLDFLAGTQTRCPRWLRRVNLEWAWRLATNPTRLGPRYFRCALLFAELLARRALVRHRVQ